jgi:hypothetical protein
MITMILGGIWHGARINFLWWGIYQGLLLVGHRLLEPVIEKLSPGSGTWKRTVFDMLCWAGFFHLVCYGWLLFRAETNEQIWNLTQAIPFGWGEPERAVGMLARLVWFCWPLWLVELLQLRSNNLLAVLNWPWPARAAFYGLSFYLTITFGAFHVVEFIYFQF